MKYTIIFVSTPIVDKETNTSTYNVVGVSGKGYEDICVLKQLKNYDAVHRFDSVKDSDENNEFIFYDSLKDAMYALHEEFSVMPNTDKLTAKVDVDDGSKEYRWEKWDYENDKAGVPSLVDSGTVISDTDTKAKRLITQATGVSDWHKWEKLNGKQMWLRRKEALGTFHKALYQQYPNLRVYFGENNYES